MSEPHRHGVSFYCRYTLLISVGWCYQSNPFMTSFGFCFFVTPTRYNLIQVNTRGEVMYAVICNKQFWVDIQKVVESRDDQIVLNAIGDDIDIFAEFEKIKRLPITHLIIDVTTFEDENSFLTAINRYRIIHANTQLIIIAPGFVSGNKLLHSLVTMSIYNIITPLDELPESLMTSLNEVLDQPYTYENAAKWIINEEDSLEEKTEKKKWVLGLPKVEIKLSKLSAVVSNKAAIKLPKKKDRVSVELCWDESGDPEASTVENAKELLGCVIWFWGSVSERGVTNAANQYAKDLAKSVPVLLLDGNLTNPGLGQEYKCSGTGWENSWLAKTPGVPPKNFYAKGNLTVWLLKESVEVDNAADMWDVALFHIRTPRLIIVVDGGSIPPPDQVDINFPVGQPEREFREDNQRGQQMNPAGTQGEEDKRVLVSMPLPKPDATTCEETIAKVLNTVSAFIIMVDADGLKGINDKYGHATGTAYLTEIWNRLHNIFTDTLWRRYGGDEFYGVIESNKVSEAELLARAETISEVTNIHGRVIKIACSIGLYGAAKGESAIATMAMADHAMYKVKKNHHGGVKVFDSKRCLILIGEWSEEWITVPISEGWRVLVYPENMSLAAMAQSNLIVAKKPIPDSLTPVWIPENEDISKLVRKLSMIGLMECVKC